jgi:hypothetical protein
MNLILENLNKWAGKAEGLAGNVWGHCKYTRFFFSFFSFPHIFLGFGVLCDLKSVAKFLWVLLIPSTLFMHAAIK